MKSKVTSTEKGTAISLNFEYVADIGKVVSNVRFVRVVAQVRGPKFREKENGAGYVTFTQIQESQNEIAYAYVVSGKGGYTLGLLHI